MTLNEWENIINIKSLFSSHYQPRNFDEGYINLENNYTKFELIKKQITLAKKHGIYGFGINYYWFSGKKLYDEPINIFLENKEINFPFFLIWKNDKYEFNCEEINKSIIIENFYEPNDTFIFISDTKKYLTSKKYIKINNKPILAIYEPFIIPNLIIFLSNLRKHAKNSGINKIFILATKNKTKDLNSTTFFDYFFEYPPKNII